MGQRFLQLNSTYTGNSDGSAVLHVSQVPPNAALFAPGPARKLFNALYRAVTDVCFQSSLWS